MDHEQAMAEKLAQSGLVPDDINATLSYPDFGDKIPNGIRIPYYLPDLTPHPAMWRARILPTPVDGSGKYVQPSAATLIGAGRPATDATYPYFPPHGINYAKLVSERQAPLKHLLVEGEFKAASGSKFLHRPTAGIGGCSNGTFANDKGVHQLQPVLARVYRKGDHVEVILDGDMATNPNVAQAAGTLRHCLVQHGCSVSFVVLPPGMGLDDWLMSLPPETRAAAFEQLPRIEGSDLPINRVTMISFLGLVVVDDKIVLNEMNMLRVLERHPRYAGKIWFDEIRNVLFQSITGETHAITDAFCFGEAVWMQQNIHLSIKPPMILNCITSLPGRPEYCRNTFKEYLATLKWDETSRLETMFIDGWGAVDTEYVRAVGKTWMISIIARALDPGCQVDTMLVLEGRQNMGKSTSLKIIGGPWHVEMTQTMDSKDFLMAAHRYLVVDLAEMNSFTRADYNFVKGFITVKDDEFRSPYGRISQTHPRHFVFVGTTNETQYLRDATGNRRFLPIACVKISREWVVANRDQLFAEAAVKYAAGHAWHIEMSITEQEQASRVMHDPWIDKIGEYLEQVETVPAITMGKYHWHFAPSLTMFKALDLTAMQSTPEATKRIASIIRVHYPEWHEHRYHGKPILVNNVATTKVRGYRKLRAGQVITDDDDNVTRLVEVKPPTPPAASAPPDNRKEKP